VPGAIVTKIESNGVGRIQPCHEAAKRLIARPHDEVEVVGHQCPGEAGRTAFEQDRFQQLEEAAAVPIVVEDRAFLDPTSGHVMNATGRVSPGTSRHIEFSAGPEGLPQRTIALCQACDRLRKARRRNVP
jgi:hypothetical protein